LQEAIQAGQYPRGEESLQEGEAKLGDGQFPLQGEASLVERGGDIGGVEVEMHIQRLRRFPGKGSFLGAPQKETEDLFEVTLVGVL